MVRPPTVVERIVVDDAVNESAPVPPLGSRLMFGRPKLGWLKAFVVSARICRLNRSPIGNDLPAGRFTSSIPGLRRFFLLRFPKVPAPGGAYTRASNP